MDWKALSIPEKTGVYLMKGESGKVLYVGKARNLKSRVSQYFNLHDSREFIPHLIADVADIQFVLTRSEKEALLLEAQLVRRLKPRYNVRLQDDKNYLLVRVDFQRPFARIEFVRSKAADQATYFGPYPSARTLREFVRFLSRLHRLRVCTDSVMNNRVRPCVLHGMGWCSAPCVLPEENGDYGDRLRLAVDLLTRRRQDARQRVQEEMLKASEELRFEEAAKYRDLGRELDSLWARQFVRVGTPLDADVFGVFQTALGGTAYVLHVRDSLVVGTRSFFSEGLSAPQEPDLESLLFQFYEERDPPPMIISALAPKEGRPLVQLLQERHGGKVSLVQPERGDRKALLDMAVENAREAHQREESNARGRDELMAELQRLLRLPERPVIVECADISSFQGGDAVGAISVSRAGVMSSSDYRCFHIKGSTTDDFVMLSEVIERRFKQVKEDEEPRLLVLDGGRPQMRAVLPLMDKAPAGLYLAALAKARPEKGLMRDRLFLPGQEEPVEFPDDSRSLHFLMALRDEAHRFAVTFHRKKRRKRTLSSPLFEIPGIGKKRRMALIHAFGSFAGLQEASLEQIQAIPGFPGNVAVKVYEWCHNRSSGADGEESSSTPSEE